MPMLAVAEVSSTGKMRAAATPRLRPATRSSCDSVPASKNFSISASSASATISMSASRATLAVSIMLPGMDPSTGLPLPSLANMHAFIDTRSTTPANAFSSPIGSWIGITVRPKTPRSDSSERSRLARSRSRRFSAMRRGSDSSIAVSHTFSVDTSTPWSASTTTSAASATRSAARASLRKFARPGVSMKLILVLFHSAYATLADRVCLRAISSSS